MRTPYSFFPPDFPPPPGFRSSCPPTWDPPEPPGLDPSDGFEPGEGDGEGDGFWPGDGDVAGKGDGEDRGIGLTRGSGSRPGSGSTSLGLAGMVSPFPEVPPLPPLEPPFPCAWTEPEIINPNRTKNPGIPNFGKGIMAQSFPEPSPS